MEYALDIGRRFDPATSRHAFQLVATDYAITVLAEPLPQRICDRSAPGRWSSAPTCSKRKVLPFEIIWRKILRGSSSTGN